MLSKMQKVFAGISGFRIQDTGCRLRASRCWILDSRYQKWDARCRVISSSMPEIFSNIQNHKLPAAYSLLPISQDSPLMTQD